jgi:hypothetical protein
MAATAMAARLTIKLVRSETVIKLGAPLRRL